MNTNNLPPLPNISKEEREFLHYNQNTDDLVLWVMGYAAQYGQLCRQQLLDTIEQQRKLLEQALGALERSEPVRSTNYAAHDAIETEIDSHLRQQEVEKK